MPDSTDSAGAGAILRRVKNLPAVLYAVAALVFFVILFSILNPAFFSLFNFNIIGLAAMILLTAGIGQCWTIVTGGIDLSVGGVISLTSVIFIQTVPRLGVWAYPLCLAIGAACGFINGNLLTRIKIPSFIATLGTGGILVSFAYLISPVATSAPFVPPSRFDPLDVVNGAWLFGIPNAFLIGGLFFAAFLTIQYFTVTGRNIFYVGSNVRMSWLSGVNIVRTKNMAFMFSGIGAATAGLILASRQFSGYPTIGATYILSSIATVVLGGSAMTGGAGGVVNTLVGALLMGVLQNGMTVVGVDVYLQQSLLGALIIVCVWISFDRSKVEIVK
ncbi:MAG: ABC transporter permease [Planctomycetota bacterium]|jgi:ribose/xylose/arabinose/galactoside ABC-type transport system permease subunit|nr:ABC transporter permease [Planctomycetota bacterium]